MELACTTTLLRGDDERVKLAVGELLDAAATKLRAPALADARIDAPIRAYVGQIFTTLCMRGDWCENEWCDAAVPHLLTLMGESRGHGDACEDALARADEAAYQTELNEFYSEANWFDNYGDTPWAEAVFCFKQSTDYWAGLQCYSPRCAEPTVASFTCGNVTLSAKSF